MDEKDTATERRGILQLLGVAVVFVLIYNIGQHDADDLKLLLLGGGAILLGVPLGCVTWPPSETGRQFTLPRVLIAGFASLAAVVVTGAIGYFYPEQPYVSPIVICVGLLLAMHWQAP